MVLAGGICLCGETEMLLVIEFAFIALALAAFIHFIFNGIG